MAVKPMRPRPNSKANIHSNNIDANLESLRAKLFSLLLRFEACYINGYNVETVEEYIKTFSVTKTVQ